MKTLIFFLTTLFCVTFTQSVTSQVISQYLSEDDVQVDRFKSVMKRNIQPFVQPNIDFEAIDKKNKAIGKYNVVAVKKTQNYNESYGEWFEQEGMSLWVIRIKASRAKNLNFWFDHLTLPESATMYIYANDTRFLQGPIKSRNLYDNTFSSDLIEGKDVLITVEMYTHEIDDFSITIKDINQGIPTSSAFRGWQDALDCHYDINCSEGNGWSLQRDAVGFILSGGDEICTGTLINNVHSDLRPFFLTANHFAITSLSNATFRFKYEASSTNCPGNSSGNQGTWITFTGGTLRASHTDSDMKLLELNQDIVGIKNLALAGWNRSSSVPSSGSAIHHPQGDAKKISLYTDAVAVDNSSFPGAFLDIWEVIWDKGLTEFNSSGGALFDQNKRIVGQLAGSPGGQNCSTIDAVGRFGRMDVSWGGNVTNSGRLSNWLYDKSGTPSMTLNGIRVPYINPYTTSTDQDLVCTSNKTFSLVNSIPGRTVTWSVSNSSLFGSSTSGSGTYATLRAANSNSKGAAILTFKLSKSGSPDVNVTRDIWVGKPKLDFAKVNGSTSTGYSVVYPPANLTVGALGEGSTATWTRTSGSGNIYPNGNACLVYHNNVATVEASSSNTCGTAILHSFVLDDPSLMPISDDDIYFRNPTDGITDIDLSEIDSKVNSISIFTSDYKLIKKLLNVTDDHVTVDLTGNSSGLYFIAIETADRMITKKLIKN